MLIDTCILLHIGSVYFGLWTTEKWCFSRLFLQVLKHFNRWLRMGQEILEAMLSRWLNLNGLKKAVILRLEDILKVNLEYACFQSFQTHHRCIPLFCLSLDAVNENELQLKFEILTRCFI